MKQKRAKLKRCSFKEGLQFCGMVIVPITIREKTRYFILDSGSQSNCINEADSELMTVFTGNGETIQTYGIDNHSCESSKGQLTYEIAGHSFMEEFNTISGQTFEAMARVLGIEISGLMGVPFMRQHNCIIDFAKGVVTVDVSSPEEDMDEEDTDKKGAEAA